MQLGLYNYKGNWIPFETERKNLLLLGKAQTGKTETLTQLALNDIYAGESVAFFGDITPILERIPLHRRRDVIVLNPVESPFALNLFYGIDPAYHSLLAGKLYEAVKSIWFGSSVSTANIEQYLRASIQTLLSVVNTTFLHIKVILTDQRYRAEILPHVSDPALIDFWRDFNDLNKKEQRLETSSTLNKLKTFAMEPLVRNCLAQEWNALSWSGKIVLIELPEHRLGSENARLLGTLILAMLYVAGAQGVRTNLYIDEAERFGATIVRDLLTADTIPTVIALQSLTLLREERERVLGAVDAILAFRTTVEDAKDIEPEYFLDTFVHLYDTEDFHAYLPTRTGHVKLRMSGISYSKKKGARQKILARCRGEYTTRQKSAIEKRVRAIFERGKE